MKTHLNHLFAGPKRIAHSSQEPCLDEKKKSPSAGTRFASGLLGAFCCLATGLNAVAISGAVMVAVGAGAFAAEEESGFKALFNGKDTAGWHVRKETSTNAWKVEDGVLKNDLKPGGHGVDLISDAKFRNFVVRYEYSVPAGSNSGFYLRGRHEIQILGQKDNEPKDNGDGGIYRQHKPLVFASKPCGEWNTVEATMVGDKITVKMNGQLIHDGVESKRPTGSQLDDNVEEPGPLMLQGDHGAVSFRNIRIKELP